MEKLTHFSLFSGIGGADLAAEWAGFETVGQVEWADYPTKVLEKHWPKVPRWRDIRDVTGEAVKRTIGYRNISVLSGGFPCQPFSIAGQRKGKDDDRYLWPEMLRVISELKPAWIVGENVIGFVNLALEETCLDLEKEGYEVQSFIIPACGVNAMHKRERVFIIANSNKKLWGPIEIFSRSSQKSIQQAPKQWEQFQFVNYGNNNIKFREEDKTLLCGNDDGISGELDKDRLNCLGNAIVPQQVYPIFQAIADIERMESDIA